MLARGGDGRNHQVGITLPPAMPALEAFHHRRTGGVKHDDLELGEHLLRVQQPSVRQGCLSRRSFQGKVAPPTEYFSDDHRWQGNLGPRHTLEMPAQGRMALPKGPEDICIPEINTRYPASRVA
jgi:hypothetical protein